MSTDPHTYFVLPYYLLHSSVTCEVTYRALPHQQQHTESHRNSVSLVFKTEQETTVLPRSVPLLETLLLVK